ncbi:MAG: ATP-binding protein [Candidatus Chromulinivorax sp.]
MMIQREFWKNRIEQAWKKKTIIWLMGVRRIGKTSLCKSLENAEYFDCETARVRSLLVDYELFLEQQKGKRIILDEIHMLPNPSEILKVAADHYPDVKIIATGSSTLGASAKFKDSLTGRKKEIWLTPMLLQESELFGNIDIAHRFLFGGFPSIFIEQHYPEDSFKEWINAYWAKDVQELFVVAKRHSFIKFTELLLVNSGGMFEASKFTVPCEVGREAIMNYLQILEETFVIHVIRPYSSHKTVEIVKAPKIYGFDTGFVCYAKGRNVLRPEDYGFMWEHFVLNEMQGVLQTRSSIKYWRDKRGYEMDFVIEHRGYQEITAIECKFSILQDVNIIEIGKNFQAFREFYPEGENIVVVYSITHSFVRIYKDIEIHFMNLEDMIAKCKTFKLF